MLARAAMSLAAALATLTVGCGGDGSLDISGVTVGQLAMGETSSSDAEGALGELAFSELPAAAPGKADGATTLDGRIAALKAFVAARLECAQVVEVDKGATLTFGQSCSWAGTRWTGAVTITYTDPNAAQLTFDGLSVRGATTAGTLAITRLGDGHVSLTGQRTITRAADTVTATLTGDYRWDDTSATIVSAQRTRTVDGDTATFTATDVHWLRSEIAPERGTMAWTTRAGATYTVVFSRNTTGDLVVTVTTPRGVTVLAADDVVT